MLTLDAPVITTLPTDSPGSFLDQDKTHICHPEFIEGPIGELVPCLCGVRRPRELLQDEMKKNLCQKCLDSVKELLEVSPEYIVWLSGFLC